MTGALSGVRIIDATTMGPGPFAAMMLADMGADVVRVERPGGVDGLSSPQTFVPHRNRSSIGLDIRTPEGRDIFLRLVETADVVLEGNRPGVMERNLVGPEQCAVRNPHLIYARMTGYGQSGPRSAQAGHDINYIAVAGALSTFAREGEIPLPPTNLVGDFGGGGMMLAFGVACALLERAQSRTGQVLDVSMVDGVASLLASTYGLRAGGDWSDIAGTNLVDSGAPFYNVYRTADDRHLAVGALEDKFYDEFVVGLGLPEGLPTREDRAHWPVLRHTISARIAELTLAEWIERFESRDACVTAVLTLEEATTDSHNVARSTYLDHDGIPQPAPAPRFSRTPGAIRRGPAIPGADTEAVLASLGYDDEIIQKFRAAKVVF